MHFHLVVLSTILSRLLCVASQLDSGSDFTVSSEDGSFFLPPETVSSPSDSEDFGFPGESFFDQPDVPSLDQASIFYQEAPLTDNSAFEFLADISLLENDSPQLTDSCLGSEEFSPFNGISKSRTKRLDVASGFCSANPISNGGPDDHEVTNDDPRFAKLIQTFQANRAQDLEQAMLNDQQNAYCHILTAGLLPWGVCYAGYRGREDINYNQNPFRTIWTSWSTVSIASVIYGENRSKNPILIIIISHVFFSSSSSSSYYMYCIICILSIFDPPQEKSTMPICSLANWIFAKTLSSARPHVSLHKRRNPLLLPGHRRVQRRGIGGTILCAASEIVIRSTTSTFHWSFGELRYMWLVMMILKGGKEGVKAVK